MKMFSLGKYVITIHRKDELDHVRPVIAAEAIRAGEMVAVGSRGGGGVNMGHGYINPTDAKVAEIERNAQMPKGAWAAKVPSWEEDKPVEWSTIKIKTDGPPKLKAIRRLAHENGWRELWHREDESRIRFKRGTDILLDIWYSKMTIGTILTHPTKGRNQLFRKNVSQDMLKRIIENPRVHTDEGYYTTK